MDGLVVIGYDGSPDANRALDIAAGILRAKAVLVVNIWQSPLGVAPSTVPLGPPLPSSPAEDEQLERAARDIAEEGAARVRALGLAAEAEVRRGVSVGDIAKVLGDVAEERDAELVVVGRRGMSRLTAMVLGSVADATVRDGRRPVLVVPTAPERD